MSQRAIITDLDGTAVDSPHTRLPSARLIAAVQALQPYYVITAATGRPWSFARPVIEALKLTVPCIVAGGTQIRQPLTGEVLWQMDIAPSALKEVLAVCSQNPDNAVVFNDIPEEYSTVALPLNEFRPTEPVYFFAQIYLSQSKAEQTHSQLQAIPTITSILTPSEVPNLYNDYVTHAEATKEHAVAKLQELLSISPADTIGIGDGSNDVHLFAAVGTKIAMGNAVPALKAAADKIIGSVAADGLAEFFEQLATEQSPSMLPKAS